MADATDLQTSFLGGEWSPYGQGRADGKDYRIAMSTCRNGYPIEAGAWTRRQGFRFCDYTRYGQPGWLLPMAFEENKPYTLEFTNQHLRLFNGPGLVFTNDIQSALSVSTADPAVLTTITAHGWSNGDMVRFLFASGVSYPLAAPLMNRTFLVGGVSGATLTLTDPITGLGLDGSTLTYVANTAQVARVLDIASPYTAGQIQSINKIQAEGVLVTLHPAVTPWSLTVTANPSAADFATFNYAAAAFIDGPYLDPPTDGTTLSASGASGSITLTTTNPEFVSTDVNRLVRMFSEPAAWASGTAYTTGQSVKYTDGNYYVALANSTGKNPDVNPTLWGVTTTVAAWTWLKITAVNNSTNVTATVMGSNILNPTVAATVWRLGVYSDTTGYPTNGVWHEGRLWLSGAVGNRTDASVSNDPFNFAPTESDGTVTDASAIDYTFNSEDVNQIFWMQPNDSGIVCGTQGGEWVIAASQLNDPITPTSIQAHRRSKYKGANIQAVHAGMSILFVQSEQRKVMEYVSDAFSGKYLGRNMSVNAKHLTGSNIEQLAYQQELNPVVWARTGDGSLIGMTYKRESAFVSEAPVFNGWHRHDLGSGRAVESISVGPSFNGDLESLTAITNDPDTNLRHVELMTDMFDETDTITDAWFLDDAVTPTAAVENSGATQVTFYGMQYLAGKTVSVWAGGLDLGDFTVGTDGSVIVPINSATNAPLFTDSYLSTLAASGEDFGGLGVAVNQTVNVQYPVGSGQLIQSYLATLQPDFVIDDYFNNRVFSIKRGNNGTSAAIAIFNRLTGVKQLERTAADIFGAGQPYGIVPGGGGPVILGADNCLYFSCTQNNSSTLAKVSCIDLTQRGFFGTADSQSTPDNHHLQYIGEGVVVTLQDVDFLITVGSAFAHLSVLIVGGTSPDLFQSGMQWAGHSYTPATGGFNGVCAGDKIDNGREGSYASAYSVSSDTTHLNIFKTTISTAGLGYNNPPTTTGTPATKVNSGIVTALIHTLAPTDIDASWTVFSAVRGPLYDPNDGNLLFYLTSPLASGTKEYVVKLNAATGAVIWKTAQTVDGQDSLGISNCNIKDGQLAFLSVSTSSTLHSLATSTGAAATPVAIGALSSNWTICTDNDGSIVTWGSWDGTTLTGVNGTTTFSGRAYKIQGYPAFPGDVTEQRSVGVPVVIGFTYTSQGATLRDVAPDATGARNGPALGKTRRTHRFSCLLANAQGISFGSDLDFGTLRSAQLKTKGGKGAAALAVNVLYSGVFSDTLDADYDYDNSPAWQITRPYPATVCSIQGFLHTQDR